MTSTRPEEAAADYARRLGEAAAAEHAADMSDDRPEKPGQLPRLDIVLLGVGPDAHVASLFPEQAGIREKELTVVGVRNSPKPPPQRVSLTLPAINTASEVWMVVAGEDKAGAVGLALAGANPVQVPAAGPARPPRDAVADRRKRGLTGPGAARPEGPVGRVAVPALRPARLRRPGWSAVL